MNQKNVLTFSDEDMWDLDYHLAELIHANLVRFRELAEKKQGVASDFLSDSDGSLSSVHTEAELERGHQKFLETLDKMIYAFDTTREPDICDYDFDFDTVPVEGSGEDTRYTMELVRNEEHAYEKYQDDLLEWHEKCEEGRHLFAKYFHQCLWL